MWAVVEQVYGKKLFLVCDDQKRMIFVNDSDYDIKENNYILLLTMTFFTQRELVTFCSINHV